MFKSIKTRLTVVICGILLLVFAIQLAANFLLVDKYYTYQKSKIVQTVYDEITREIASSEDSLVEIIQNLDVDNNLEFIVADEELNFLYTNRNMPMKEDIVDPHKKNTDFDFSLHSKDFAIDAKPAFVKASTFESDKIRLLGIIEDQDAKYYLVIRISVKSISSEMKSTNLFMLYISFFAMIAGGILVYILAKQIARPIEDINQVAIKVSELDFTKRMPKTKLKDEIGSLSNNINLMADRLESNILSLQEANKKLEFDNEYMNKVDELRKEFIANISHELKTPLAILSGYAEMLNNDVPGIDKTFYYETILDETHKMDRLIKNLLDLSHMENSLSRVSLQEIDLTKLAEHIYRKNTVLFEKSNISSEFYAKPNVKVMGDPLYLEEAISNYLSNAISHTAKGGKIIMNIETT
ncbi:MAG: HAMP domain-containing sensor histidine kinase, partial [Mobilitalea sp.]